MTDFYSALASVIEPGERSSKLTYLKQAFSRCRRFFPWAYGGVLAVAELLVASMRVEAGMAAHVCLLAVLLAHATAAFGTKDYPLYVVLALAPLIRILSLSLPLARFPLVYWYVLTGVPILAAAAVAAYLAGIRPAECGFKLGGALGLPVALSGVPLGLAEFFILRPSALVSSPAWGDWMGPALILMIFTGFTEELVFRGLMQSAARRALGDAQGLFFVASVFAVLHITHLSLLDVLFVFGVALFFGWVVKKEGSILGVSVAHGLTNVGLYILWPHVWAL